MPDDQRRRQYRRLIDALVTECQHGQGQVFPERVRSGVWSRYAVDHPDEMPEEDRMNTVLARLGAEDRAAIARILELSYQAGVHDSLRVLHDNEVPPFDDAYEGTPFHDFMGRLMTDWEWPT